MCADHVPDVRASFLSLWCHNTDFCGSNAGSQLFLRQKLKILVRAPFLAPTRGGGGLVIKQDSVVFSPVQLTTIPLVFVQVGTNTVAEQKLIFSIFCKKINVPH